MRSLPVAVLFYLHKCLLKLLLAMADGGGSGNAPQVKRLVAGRWGAVAKRYELRSSRPDLIHAV
jgi:hypothetical protein